MARARKEYEVERIVRARVSYKKGRKIHWQFLVKWKGYTDKANTWEPIDSFETSPQLIEKFWKKVDTGGRDVGKASSFSLREELSPRDDTWSDVGAEGDEDEEQKEGEESASPKPGRKRPAKAADGAPKRKRGRPSKAEKAKNVEAADESKVSEELHTFETVGGGGSASIDASIPEKEISVAPPTNDARSKRFIHVFSTVDSDDVDDDASELTSPPRKAVLVRKSIIKKRKVCIESDEENDVTDRASDASSHAGSLFSGEDSSEKEQIVPAETIRRKDAAPEKPMPAPLLAGPLIREESQKPRESKKPKIALTREGRPVPRVKMIDEPSIQKAIELRVYGRGSYAPNAGNASQTAPPMAPSKSVDQERIPYKPSLLTFEKGKLVSYRRKVATPSPQEPAMHPYFSTSEPLVVGSATLETATASSTSQLASPRDFATSRRESTDPEPRDTVVMDTSPDVISSANNAGNLEINEVVALESPPAGPPPTADELLRLSGENDTATDLPDFPAEEIGPFSQPMHATAGSSQIVADSAAVEEPPAWKQSALFRVPIPSTILQKVVLASKDEPDPPANPGKLTIPLRLGRTAVVPVILKDEQKPVVGVKLSQLLKSNELDGSPGKLFPRGSFNFDCIGKPCSNARIVLDDDCSEEQRSWFSKFVDELGRDNVFFVEIGRKHYILLSSENATARHDLLMGTQNSGLRKAAIMQFAPVIDKTLYERCAEKGQDIRLE